MNIASLPSKYGIGVIGEEAVSFAKLIKEMGFSKWQILPLNPPALMAANSPYSSNGAFAGNIAYIDPVTLFYDGLVSPDDVRRCEYYGSPYRVDFEFVNESRLWFRRSPP